MPHQVLVEAPIPDWMVAMLDPECDLHVLSQAPGMALDDMDGFMTYGHFHTDGPFMDRMPKLKVVSNFGVGVDHIDLEAARARGVAVGNTPRMLDNCTADMAIALMLATARNMIIGDRFARSDKFTHYDPSLHLGRDVSNTTLGIIGLGNIGYQVARRGLAFDMEVLYYNRRKNEKAEADLAVEYVALDELLTRADFVVLCVPLTAQTDDLIGARELGLMKETAYLINVARGGVVNTDALYEALAGNRIMGAGLDVTEPEPLPRDHPLLELDNLVLMPHLGSCARQTRETMARRTIDNLQAGLEGKPLPTAVV